MSDAAVRPRAGPLRRLFAVALALAALWAGAEVLLALPPVPLALLTMAIAWPIWVARVEAAQMDRRLLIEGMITHRSWVYRALWPGYWVALIEAGIAGIAALLLLAICTQFSAEHWAVLGAGGAVLALLAGPLMGVMKQVARPGMAEPLLRRWPLSLLAIVGLCIGFFTVDYALLGAPDTRALAWADVASDAYARGAGAKSQVVAWLVGGVASADALAWHLSQIFIPTLREGALRAASWVLVLGGAGLVALIASRLMIGALAVASGPAGAIERSSRPVAAIALLAIALLAVTPHLVTERRGGADDGAAAAGALAGLLDPCGQTAPSPAGLSAAATREITDAERIVAQLQEARLSSLDSQISARTAKGIETYLDWHFSLRGEYERLAAAALGDLADTLRAELMDAVPSGQSLADRLAAERRMLDSLAELRFAAAAKQAGHAAEQAVSTADCLGADALALRIDALGELTSRPIPEGAIAAAGVTLLPLRQALKRVAGAGAGRLSAQAARRLAARQIARAAAKRGTGAVASAGGAAAICAPGGPLALACGLGAGVLTWIGVDLLAIEIAEARGRERMRAALARSLSTRNNALIAELRRYSSARTAALADAHRRRLAKAFIPARDG